MRHSSAKKGMQRDAHRLTGLGGHLSICMCLFPDFQRQCVSSSGAGATVLRIFAHLCARLPMIGRQIDGEGRGALGQNRAEESRVRARWLVI
jgi:hypothetical protein